MNDQNFRLPIGWAWTTVSDIARVVGGGTPSSKDLNNFADLGVPWITPSDLTDYKSAYISKGKRDLSNRGYLSCGAKLLPKGSVLFSSRAPIGYCVIAKEELCTSQGFKSLVLRKKVLPEFVRYYLLSAKEYIESISGGTTFPELSGARFASMKIPIAPYEDQKNAVKKIDKFFEKISKSQTELSNLPSLIQRYRWYLLQAAYDGSLTRRPKSPSQPISEIAEHLRYGTSRKSYIEARGTPVLRIPNIGSRKTDLTDLKYSVFEEKEYEKLRLATGDLLVVRSNGSANLVGRPAVIEKDAEGMAYAGYLIRIKPKVELVDPHYLAYMIQAPVLRSQIESKVTSTSGIHNVNARQLAELIIPVPNLDEQKKITQKLNLTFDLLDRAEGEIGKALIKLEDLRKKVLLKIFNGTDEREYQESPDMLGEIYKSDFLEFPKFQLNTTMESSLLDNPKAAVLSDSLNWPVGGLPFEDIVKGIYVEHDQMRDAIFSLLEGETPELVQFFDTESGRILLKRSDK